MQSGEKSRAAGGREEHLPVPTHVSILYFLVLNATYGALARPPSRQPMIPELHTGQRFAHPAKGRGAPTLVA